MKHNKNKKTLKYLRRLCGLSNAEVYRPKGEKAFLEQRAKSAHREVMIEYADEVV